MASKTRQRAAQLAQRNIEIFERGGYPGPGGWVDIADAIEDAVMDTRLWRPDQLRGALRRLPAEPLDGPARISVSAETTQAAARRLVVDEGVDDLVLLNFASGRNPGGGFLSGSKAQEEDLARCSALYPCLTSEQARPYYAVNRHSDTLYTDHMIWSPRVPFFGVEGEALLDEPFLASIITAPAPNAGAYLDKGGSGDKRGKVEDTLRERAGLVLALAEAGGHRNVLLGAWGCGVFRNDPALVADAFARWLEDHRFARSFERVVFGVYDPKGATRAAFSARFESAGR